MEYSLSLILIIVLFKKANPLSLSKDISFDTQVSEDIYSTIPFIRSINQNIFISNGVSGVIYTPSNSSSTQFSPGSVDELFPIKGTSHPIVVGFNDTTNYYLGYIKSDDKKLYCQSNRFYNDVTFDESLFSIKAFNEQIISFITYQSLSSSTTIGFVDCSGTISSTYQTILNTNNILGYDIFVDSENKKISFLLRKQVENIIMSYSLDTVFGQEYSEIHEELPSDIFYSENVNLSNQIYIFCYNIKDENNVYCLKMIYESGKIIKITEPKSVLICTNVNTYFKMNKLSSTKVILSCGTTSLSVQVIDINFNILSTQLQISVDNFNTFDITSYSENTIFIAGNYKSNSDYLYKGDLIFFSFDGEQCSDNSITNFYSFYFSENAYHSCTNNCLYCSFQNSKEVCSQCTFGFNLIEYEDSSIGCATESTKPDNFYLDSSTNKFIKCNMFWYKDSNNETQCDQQCPSSYQYYTIDNKCLSSCDSLIFDTYQCVDRCPDGYHPDDLNQYCIPYDYIEVNEDMNITTTYSKEDIISHIKFDDFVSEGRNIISNEGYILQVYPSTNSIEDNSISSLSLGACEDLLRKEHSISQSDPLIIVKFDIPNPQQISPSVEYRVYDKEGNELSMDICKGVNIEIGYPIIDKEKAQLSQGELMYRKGFDVYNPEDDFFNEKCVSFSNSSTDVTIKDRRENFFLNVTFCNNNCVYNGIDYNTSKVQCECQISNQNKTTEVKTFTSFGNQLLEQTNLPLFKCYKEATSFNNLKSNIGFYFCASSFIVQLFLFLIFLLCGFRNIYSKFCAKLDMIMLSDFLSIDVNDFNTENEDIDIDNCIYKEAIEKEERNAITYFIVLLLKQIEPINIFFFSGDYNLYPIAISVLLFSLASDFTMNALLFSDDVISQRYQNQGELNPLTTLLLSFCSNVLGFLISAIAMKMTSFESILEFFSKEIKPRSSYALKFKKIMKVVKLKIYIYFGFEFVMMGIYLYFLCSFCSVYKASQWNWFSNGLTSMVISFVGTLCMSFLITLCRFVGLWWKSEKIYNVSLYLMR